MGRDSHLYAGCGGFGEPEAHKGLPALSDTGGAGPSQSLLVPCQAPALLCAVLPVIHIQVQ